MHLGACNIGELLRGWEGGCFSQEIALSNIIDDCLKHSLVAIVT